ncbi:RNA pyrophosphohydrolase [Cobetia sp. MB87]|nr:RNA pyrophosphohydrolase [Cobetia sp. MB87]
MIDADGFRPNVGIIIANCEGQLLWARRVGQNAWQFPQGGIKPNETPQQALFRELEEEIGLKAEDVEILACTRGWLRYRLPRRMVRTHSRPICIGQKQKWFLLQIRCQDNRVSVDTTPNPEFDGWRWVSYWYPLGQVVAFKREVYRRALRELAPRLQRLVDTERLKALAEGPSLHEARGACGTPGASGSPVGTANAAAAKGLDGTGATDPEAGDASAEGQGRHSSGRWR